MARHVPPSPPEPPPMPTHAGRYVLGDGAWDRIDQDAASPDDAPAAVEPTELVLAIPPAIAPVPQPED